MAAELPNNGRSPAFDSRILDLLACPACFARLELAGETILCAGCGRAYPLIDGIPVLIAERATLGTNGDSNQARSIASPGNAGS